MVLALALAQTLVWAGGFYVFPALLATWHAELGWSKATLSGAFTAALLVAAAASPLAGRLVDRGHGRALMALSATGVGLGLLLLSRVTTPWAFAVVWALIGLALAGALYDACFSFVTHRFPHDARRVITRITLVAGFAGTVSFPTAAWTASAFGWRGSLVVFALLILAVAVPLVWSVGGESARPSSTRRRAAAAGARRTLARPAFWGLTLAFALMALVQGMIITHLLPLLADRGVAAGAAVLAASCIGPMQVVGRLAMMAVERHVAIAGIALAMLAVVLAGLVALWLAPSAPALVAVFVLLHGAGYGVYSIVRPVLTAEVLGRDGFGVVHGTMATAAILATAAAPSLAAVIQGLGGYDVVIVAAITAILTGLAALVAALRTATR
ncbi:MAG: MFS transporter [Alphaproteobacteria bacterium]|nr:MFS transporter [Alphaproteobacteria bacterium]